MFDNFNKHKQTPFRRLNGSKKPKGQAEFDPPRDKESDLYYWFVAGLAASPMKLRHVPLFMLLAVGLAYCISLILFDDQSAALSRLLENTNQSQETVRMALPSQEALEVLFDSLEQADIDDSILQSRQTYKNHAQKSIHP
jgi:hypothetical protein